MEDIKQLNKQLDNDLSNALNSNASAKNSQKKSPDNIAVEFYKRQLHNNGASYSKTILSRTRLNDLKEKIATENIGKRRETFLEKHAGKGESDFLKNQIQNIDDYSSDEKVIIRRNNTELHGKESRAEISKDYKEYKNKNPLTIGNFFTIDGLKEIVKRKEKFLDQAVNSGEQPSNETTASLQKEDLSAIKIKNQLSAYQQERGVKWYHKLFPTSENKKLLTESEKNFYSEIQQVDTSESSADENSSENANSDVIQRLFGNNPTLKDELKKVASEKLAHTDIKDKLAGFNQDFKNYKKSLPWTKHPFKRIAARKDFLNQKITQISEPADIVALQAFNGGSFNNPSSKEKLTKIGIAVGVGVVSLVAMATGGMVAVPFLIGAAVGANKLYKAVGSHKCIKKGVEKLAANSLSETLVQSPPVRQIEQEQIVSKSVSKDMQSSNFIQNQSILNKSKPMQQSDISQQLVAQQKQFENLIKQQQQHFESLLKQQQQHFEQLLGNRTEANLGKSAPSMQQQATQTSQQITPQQLKETVVPAKDNAKKSFLPQPKNPAPSNSALKK